MPTDPATIEQLRSAYAQCFGCGRDNPTGLRLDGFETVGGSVRATFEPDEVFAGFEGVLHGGVVATALDEVSAWSAMLTEGVFVYTARLDLSYRRKVPTGEPLELRATVTERRGRRLTIEAAVTDGDGKTLASSNGLFVVAQKISDVQL